MTLKEFGKCFIKLWYVVIGCLLLSLLIAYASVTFLSSPANENRYSTSTTMTVNSGVAVVNGIAKNQMNSVLSEFRSLQGSVTVNDTSSSVSINVEGDSESDCISASSQIVEKTISVAREFYPNGISDAGGASIPFAADIQDVSVSESGNSFNAKTLLITLLIGLFISICAVLIIYVFKKPILTKEQIESETGFPVISEIPRKQDPIVGEKLLANTRFAKQNNDVQSITVLPVGDKTESRRVAELILEAYRSEGNSAGEIVEAEERFSDADILSGFVVVECEPLSSEISGAYASQKTDVTVVVAKEWKGSLTLLNEALEELRLANATIAGVVLLR